LWLHHSVLPAKADILAVFACLMARSSIYVPALCLNTWFGRRP
jgi:hypothetical protein